MKTGRTTSKENPEQRRRSGHTYRKLSSKMKRRLRREKKKGACEHYRTRSPNPQVAEEAAAAEMSRAVYVERKSREQSLYKDRVSRNTLISVLEQAMEAEGRRHYGSEQDLEAMYNEEIGQIELYRFRTVVSEVSNQVLQISLKAAREDDPGCRVGDSIGIKVGDYIDFAQLVDVVESERAIKPQLVFASLEGSEDLYTECTRRNARVAVEVAAWYYV